MDRCRANFACSGNQISQFGAQERSRNLGQERRELLPIEAGDDHVRLQVSFENECFYVVRNSSVLQFDIEDALAAQRVENISQQWDRLAKSGVELAQLVIG